LYKFIAITAICHELARPPLKQLTTIDKFQYILKHKMKFSSRRSHVMCLNGCVASSQTLATSIGIDVLKKGGNAADAAVAVAAALNVTEPCSTGIGGDAFCLFYNGSTKEVSAMNGSGRAPQRLTLDLVKKSGQPFSPSSPLAVTVPGACAGWVDCVQRFGSGKLSLEDILTPAITLADDGFPVSGPITSDMWNNSKGVLVASENGHELLIKDKLSGKLRGPKTGEIFFNPGLANVFKSVVKQGKDGFYKGWVANEIVEAVTKAGGVLSLEDLASHKTTFEDAISIEYKGYRLWETQPNSQGIVALIMLNILKNFNLKDLDHNSSAYLHILIEATRLSFADAAKYVADPEFAEIPIDKLLSEEYGKERAALIDLDKSIDICSPGTFGDGDTVYFTVADKDGNFCSFINSNYINFGSGIVPKSCGFSLQNRGFNFSLDANSANCIAPGKRPYYTIIPAMVTDDKTGDLVMAYGVMGGFMQPQGHVQVLLNMLEYGMDPQEALDSLRYLVGAGHTSSLGGVSLEDGIPESVSQELAEKGHKVEFAEGFSRAKFGRGQIIASRPFWNAADEIPDDSIRILHAASDPRADGCAFGY